MIYKMIFCTIDIFYIFTIFIIKTVDFYIYWLLDLTNGSRIHSIYTELMKQFRKINKLFISIEINSTFTAITNCITACLCNIYIEKNLSYRLMIRYSSSCKIVKKIVHYEKQEILFL